jgi:hypothetical protein
MNKETHTMQLAAIMTASMQNTESTIKDRIDRSSPYWTQAYADVCVAVDREIRERKRAEKAEAACKALRSALGDALAAVWDGHYSGKGVTSDYARAVDKKAKRSITQFERLGEKEGSAE